LLAWRAKIYWLCTGCASVAAKVLHYVPTRSGHCGKISGAQTPLAGRHSAVELYCCSLFGCSTRHACISTPDLLHPWSHPTATHSPLASGSQNRPRHMVANHLAFLCSPSFRSLDAVGSRQVFRAKKETGAIAPWGCAHLDEPPQRDFSFRGILP
jgi:hypothetical protein